MAKVKKVKIQKKQVTQIVAISLAGLVVAGGVAAAVTLIEPSKTKELSTLAWSVGGINSVGAVSKSKTAICTTELFACEGLKISLEEEFDGTLTVFYYTTNGNYLGDPTVITDDEYICENPFAAKARLMYTPNLEVEDGKTERIYFWDVAEYANDFTVTVNRVQGGVLESTLKSDTSGTFYSFAEMGDKYYAGDNASNLFYYYSGEWRKIKGDTGLRTGDKVLSMTTFDNKLYYVGARSNVPGTGLLSGSFNSDKTWVYSANYGIDGRSLCGVKTVNGDLFAFGYHRSYTNPNDIAREYTLFQRTGNGNFIGVETPNLAGIYDMVYANNQYILVGQNGTVFATSDFIDWSNYTNTKYGTIQSIYYDDYGYVIGCLDGKVFSGSDLSNLHQADIENSLFEAHNSSNIVKYHDALYVIQSDSSYGELWRSEDHGATWTVVVDGAGRLNSLAVLGGELFIGADDGIYKLRNL